MRHLTPPILLSVLIVACSDPNANLDDTTVGSGGAASGGSDTAGSGGAAANATGGAPGSGGAAVSPSGGAPSGGQDGSGGADTSSGGETQVDPTSFAAGLHELFIHDACTGVQPSQPDTCTHGQLIEESVTFGGEPGTTYDLTLRIRGLLEPTNIVGGTAPLPEHPYFVIGGTVGAADYAQWQIEVEEPAEIYYLNHYPQTSHTIYKEDFEVTIPVAAGSEVTVRTVDGNDRQIDNGAMGLPDRQQIIEGVTDGVLDGQVLRLDVLGVEIQD